MSLLIINGAVLRILKSFQNDIWRTSIRETHIYTRKYHIFNERETNNISKTKHFVIVFRILFENLFSCKYGWTSCIYNNFINKNDQNSCKLVLIVCFCAHIKKTLNIIKKKIRNTKLDTKLLQNNTYRILIDYKLNQI